MAGNFYAVLMGFNEYSDKDLHHLSYAEQDAQEFYNLLTDPDIGNYPKENIKLLTGKNIQTTEVEKELYKQVVKNRSENDTVLVYYSGHGFIAGDKQQAFLGTPDITITDILDNPKAGLQMEYLHDNIFRESKARYVIFILDCCHSGAFCPSFKGENLEKGGGTTDFKQLVDDQYFHGEGRIAFVSSPAKSKSRESDTLGHGVFTYHLLEGLKGKARDSAGDVTMSSLVAHVEGMSQGDQLPVFYGKSTKIVLAKPKTDITPVHPEKLAFQIPIYDYSNQTQWVSNPLSNPIEKHIEYIRSLNNKLQTISDTTNPNIGGSILDAISASVGADYVFIERLNSENGLFHRANSHTSVSNDSGGYENYILSEISPVFSLKKSELLPMKYGFYKPLKNVRGVGQNVVVIPLRMGYPRDFLVLCGVNEAALEYGEILGHTLISLYQATKELTSLKTKQILSLLFDGIKKEFGHVPYKIYDERFTDFCNSLKNVHFGFEPIIQLGKREIQIDSWEALAREDNSSHAPYELFQAAELWGTHFTTELDLYCLRNAIETYGNLWKKERAGQKADPLSVNVYPETLYREAYWQELHQIIKVEDRIKGDKLILEISEKRPAPMEELATLNVMDAFVERLHEYSKKLNVRFAIDDFGVEHSSISRLAQLELDHVKIDREILHHPHPKNTLKYVKEMVDESHHHPVKIVLEGFDGDSNISLREIYELGIEYIQGYMIRRADFTVSDLDDKRKDLILKYMEM
jgi:EAL domain-containing protein (putative c-di-GMP-specific phosphodiesterase class I)